MRNVIPWRVTVVASARNRLIRQFVARAWRLQRLIILSAAALADVKGSCQKSAAEAPPPLLLPLSLFELTHSFFGEPSSWPAQFLRLPGPPD